MSNKTKHQRKRYAAEHALSRALALDGMVREGGELAKAGRRAQKAIAQLWIRRDTQPGKMWNKKHSKPGEVRNV